MIFSKRTVILFPSVSRAKSQVREFVPPDSALSCKTKDISSEEIFSIRSTLGKEITVNAECDRGKGDQNKVFLGIKSPLCYERLALLNLILT